MGEILEGGYAGSKKVAQWLLGFPLEHQIVFGRLIASKSAMRVLPKIGLLFSKADKKANWIINILALVFRANLVAHTICKFSSSYIETKFYSAALLAGQFGHTEDFSFFNNEQYPADSAVRSAGNAASAAAAVDSAVGHVHSAVSFAMECGDVAFAEAVWQLMMQDAHSLEQGKFHSAWDEPLWPENSIQKAKFDRTTFLSAAQSFEVWLDWYEPIAEGRTPWGLPRPIAEQIELRIALGDDRGEGGTDFWDRPHDEINAEIKSWVDAARAELPSTPRPEINSLPDVESQTQSALQFDGNADEPIGLKRLLPGEDWSLDRQSRERHAEARRLSDRVLRLCDGKHAGNNAISEFKEDFELFNIALGAELENLNPNLAIPRGDGVRRTLTAYENKDDFSKLDPVPDEVLLAAEKAIAAYNQFVALDQKLAMRDEALFGPDARKRLISPAEGQKQIASAIENGVAKTEVQAATDAEAKVAPAVPDPESRASRRYTESHRNFAREAIGRAIIYVKTNPIKVAGGTTTTLFAAAQFVWSNRFWFIEVFADNPTMTNVLGHLLRFLKVLPLA